MRRIGLCLCAALAALAALLAGCDGGAEEVTRAGTAVPVFREFKGQQAPFPDQQFVVIQTPEVWQALWRPREAPAVDFAANTVLGVTLGQRPTAGYEVTIEDVRATGTEIIAYVSTLQPDPDDPVAQVITYPYHFVVVPRLTQPVNFAMEGQETMPIALQQQYLGVQARATTAQTAVIRDDAAWRNFWVNNVGAATDAPAVDFTQYMAVAVFAGTRPTTGYAVRIIGVEQAPLEQLSVLYRVTAPQPGEQVGETPTSPYAVALVRASAMPVAF
ncbi:MAG TPA: protease complex subunit PrcB family protein, partial [Armatimonadota bacterium]|nr:protease complex subunit PrcB family protein [Armatimonadota bacterium]